MREKKKKRIVAAGHICLDITPAFQNAPAERVGDLLKPGTLVETGGADVHIGGSIANTGLGLKVLGADVALMGKVGTDSFGMIVKEQVGKYVSTAYMIESGEESTSYSVVLAPKGIDRMFLHCPGANDTFSAADPDYDVIRGADLFGWEDVRHFEASYRPDRVLSATGAGDTTIAAFLYAVLQGYEWEECVRLAAAEGASCVETYDAISGLRTLEELQRRIDAGWEKQ